MKENRFETILRLALTHKKEVDKIIYNALEKEKTYEDYNERLKAEKLAILSGDTCGKVEGERKVASMEVNRYFKEIEESLLKWMNKTISSEYLNNLIAMNTLGIKFDLNELEGINSVLGESYFGQKIMKKMYKENGQNYNSKNIGAYIQYLKNAIQQTDIFINNYCGEQLQLLKYDIGREYNREYAAVASRGRIFDRESSLLKCALFWDEQGLPCCKEKRALSEHDLKIMGMMLENDKNNTSNAYAVPQAVCSLVKTTPELYDYFALHPVYCRYLPENEWEL